MEKGPQVWKTSQVYKTSAWPFDIRLCLISLDSQAVKQQRCPACPTEQIKAVPKQEPSVGRGPGGRTGACRELGMVLPALDQADVGLGWGTLPWHISWAGRHCVEQPPPSCFSSALGLCCVCTGGSQGSPREQVCLGLLSYIQLHQAPQICVNRLSSPHVLHSLMQCCHTRPWEHVGCICGGKGPLVRDKRQGFSLKHVNGTG